MKRRNFVLLFLCATMLQGQLVGQSRWSWLWSNKKITIPVLTGLTAIPIVWGIKRFYNKKRSLQTTCKQIHFEGRIIKQYEGLPQGYTADCGYHAVYNACCLKQNNIGALLDYKKFKQENAIWKKSVEKERKGRLGNANIDSGEIEEIIIKNHVPILRNHHSEEGMKQVYLKDNVSIIDYIEGMPTMIKLDAIGGVDRHTIRNIQRFRTKKKPQVVILNSSCGDVYAHHNWSWHWFVVKLEYTKDDTVQMTVVDSLLHILPSSSTLEQLYNLFVHTQLPQKL